MNFRIHTGLFDNGATFEILPGPVNEAGIPKLHIASDGRLWGITTLRILRSIDPVDFLIMITGQPDNQTGVCPDALVTYGITGEYIDHYQWQRSTDDSVWEDIADNEYYSGTQSDSLAVIANLETGGWLYRCKVWD